MARSERGSSGASEKLVSMNNALRAIPFAWCMTKMVLLVPWPPPVRAREQWLSGRVRVLPMDGGKRG